MTEVTPRVIRWLRTLASKVRIFKFISVGAVGAVVDLSILFVLVTYGGVLEELAVLIGIEISIVLMFLLNEYWTFSDSGVTGLWAFIGRLGRSHLVRSGGIVVQLLVFILIYRFLYLSFTVESVDLWLLFAKGSGIVFGTVVNYVFESLFTWKIQLS